MRLPPLFFAALLLCWPAAAKADFRLCNNTASRVSISLAYTDGQAWVTEGWWNLKANVCETLLRGPLAAQYYYVYGMDEAGGEWKGKAFMCTRDREFKVDGRQDCFVRGYDRTGFFEVDTGKDAKNWTVQMTDPAKPGPAQPAPTPAVPAGPAPIPAVPAGPAPIPAAPTPPATVPPATAPPAAVPPASAPPAK